jgi:hypothetical protein
LELLLGFARIEPELEVDTQGLSDVFDRQSMPAPGYRDGFIHKKIHHLGVYSTDLK